MFLRIPVAPPQLSVYEASPLQLGQFSVRL